MRVSVTAATSSSQITRVTVIALPANVSADLVRNADGTFFGTLAVPAGVSQTVTANAYAGDALAGTGSNSVTVLKGQTLPLSITAFDVTGAAPRPDHSPVITSLTASASAVPVGGQVSLAAEAMDADGDAISFAWTADPAGCGTFAAPASAATAFTAARAGTCVVIVTATSRGLGDSRGTGIDVTAELPTPTLVQHVSSTMNPPVDGTMGNNYRFTLPNPVIAGNCLILGISYEWSAARTVHVADSNGNGWPANPAVTFTKGSTLISSIFVLPNARAGTTTITVSFDRSIRTFQYTVSEFNDIDSASPVAGTSGGQSTAPNLTTPAFTPANNDANGGNLIWSYFIDNEFATFNGATNFAPGSPSTLLDADIGWTDIGLPHASQYFIQRTAAAVTPSMRVTMSPENDPYDGVAVALRIAPAGSRAPASGIRVNKISHFTNGGPPTTWKFQFPTQGNLIVGIASSREITDVQSITDTRGNVYARFAPWDDEPQIWYAVNANPDPNLVITVLSAGVPVNNSFIWYDVSGADPSPPDAFGDLTGGGIDPGDNSIADAPVVAPPSLGLTIAAVSFGTGPSMGLTTGSPPDAFFDFVYYSSELDIDRMDNADGRAHLYNTDLSVEHFNWILNHSMGTTASATAVHFKAR